MNTDKLNFAKMTKNEIKTLHNFLNGLVIGYSTIEESAKKSALENSPIFFRTFDKHVGQAKEYLDRLAEKYPVE